MTTPFLGLGWKSINDRASEFKKYKHEDLLEFGVNFLDKALRGIFPDDLILFGSMPGAGKTQSAVNIALKNARNGKKVHMFALEASKNEIESRLLYSLTAQAYKNAIYKTHLDRPINYEDWISNYFGDALDDYEATAGMEMAELSNFYTFYREDKFDVQTLIENTYAIAHETDLIIVDHVHYFDYDDNAENQALHEIVKAARKIVLDIKKPMILIAHLRKKDPRYGDLVPNMYEFHGSSNLSKVATRVITLAPGKATEYDPLLFYTYMRVSKNRFNSSISRYIGRSIFDIRTSQYIGEFEIGELSEDGKDFLTIVDSRQAPYWAKK